MNLCAWMDDAACRDKDPRPFFADHHPEEAKAICVSCPVSDDCLDYAVTQRIEHGVWGGLTADQRRDHANVVEARMFLRRRRADW